MKLIMEGWRKFVKENKAGEIMKRLELLGLHMEQTNFGYNIVLVDGIHEKSERKSPFVVGMIETVKTEEPCIPKTHEIGTVATHPSVRGSGLGTYLYELAALLVHINLQGGITSDHTSSTTIPAADVWDRLENKFNYVKRKTPKGPQKDSYDPETGEEIPSYKGGNDTFDYHGWDKGVEPEKQQPGATPDPLDDCDVLTSGGKEATDHSLGIPPDRIPIINKIMNVQLQNFDNYKDRFSTGYQQQIIGNVVRDANILFNTEYNPLKLGIYGVDEK